MKQKILQFVNNEQQSTALSDFDQTVGLESLPIINAILKEENLPIGPLERLEELLKAILKKEMGSAMTGSDARGLALAMKEQDLLFKYKPYAVKAASPFGYSIFLQRPGEGFSYQNHLTHKVEVFHILDVMPGGFVFLCNYDDWNQHYEKEVFEKWLSGESHPFFDRCKFVPDPGDVFVISELGIVHTVIGCLLEEFATASTDMVQRLHDQNDRRAVPGFPVDQTRAQLKSLRLPNTSRRVDMLGGDTITSEPIPRVEHDYGHSFVFVDSFVKACHVEVEPNATVPTDMDPERVSVIRVFDGHCNVMLREDQEHGGDATVEPVELQTGQLTVIPPGIHFTIENQGDTQLSYSEHRIKPDVALL